MGYVYGERRAQHGCAGPCAGQAEAGRADAAVLRRSRRAETALVVAKAAKMAAHEKVAAERRGTARAAGKAA